MTARAFRFAAALNAPGAGGNTMTVIRAVPLAAGVSVPSLASLAFGATIALSALAGCAGPARAPGPPGETLILLENRVNGPCQLKWANARVDDRPLALATVAPPGAEAAPLDRPVLAPGEHTVSIVAAASCPTAGGPEQATVLQVTQPIYMGKTGGKITISLAGKPGGGLDAGLVASFTVVGGQVLAPRADGGEVDCRARQPMDWAVCRTEGMLARARDDKDLIRVICVNDKLSEMRLLTGTISAPSPATAGEPGAFGDIESSTAQRVLALAGEAERCVGEFAFVEGGTGVERTRPKGAPAFQ